MEKVAIIIPCYNEYKRFNVDKFSTYLRLKSDISFIFVNDGSTDKTLELIKNLSQAFPCQTFIIDFKKNLGKAEAVRQGFKKAFELDFEYIGYWDADLSTPLDAICELLEKFLDDNVTIVFGSRVKILGSDINRSKIRHYGGRVYATVASMVLNLPVYDTQCGAKIFKNSEELRKVFSNPFSVKWSFDVEILARFKSLKKSLFERPLGITAIEYPLKNWAHCEGSKVKVLDFFWGIAELLLIFSYINFPFIKRSYISRLK